VPSAKAKMMPKEKLEWQLQLLVNRSIDCSVPSPKTMMDTEREVSMASTICESTQQNKNNQVSLDCNGKSSPQCLRMMRKKKKL
jgi:hypothetical protein